MKLPSHFFLALVIVVLGGAGWYLLSPLFIDEVVDEAFPTPVAEKPTSTDSSTADAIAQLDDRELMKQLKRLTPEQVDGMSDADRAAWQKAMDDMAQKMPDTVMEDPMPEEAAQTEPVVLASGSFQDADSFHKGSGEATLYSLPDSSNLVRFENFSVTNGPALSVYLTKGTAGDVKAGFVDLGKLKGNKGSQNYTVPAGTNLDEYQSIVIYCVPFKTPFATVSLQ